MLMVRIEREVIFTLRKLLVVQVVLERAILRQLVVDHVDGGNFAGCAVEQRSCTIDRPQLVVQWDWWAIWRRRNRV